MAYYKGQGGRRKGSKNKRTDLFRLCEEKKINVFSEMLDIAMNELDPDKKFSKLKDCAIYLYSKPKDESDISDFTPEEIRDYIMSAASNEPKAG